jgi:hypothetical protein
MSNNNQDDKAKNEAPEVERELTPEEREQKQKELLEKRLAELRRRDPFIYK